MDSEQLLDDMRNGALSMNQIPCTHCRTKQGLPALTRDHFHGSDWGRCVRAVWFERTIGKSQQECTGENAMFLNDGHLHEALLLKCIEMGGHIISDRDTRDGEIMTIDAVVVPGGMTFNVVTVGHTDGVMDEEIVIECKAVKDWAWKNKFILGLIPPTYYGQVQYYLHAHKKERAFLIIKHRHTSEIIIFEIKASAAYITKRKLLLAGIEVAIKQRLAIAVPFPMPTDECRFCDWYNLCWR